MSEHVDVVIVGAGLSGIGAAHHLQDKCPDRTYAIVEARSDLGGTWDLFRYPGVRSDSDMYTLGYRLRPWSGKKSMADGQSILDYVRATASEQGIIRHIRFRSRVVSAQWSSTSCSWTLQIDGPQGRTEMTCSFLYCCSGYYRYDHGYRPEWPGLDEFSGPVVHPQQWPAELDYAGKRVLVIGSGATAVTLVPAMARTARQVTMLQRSPTYVVALSDADPLGDLARRRLSPSAAFSLIRWRNVLLTMTFYRFCQRWPAMAKKVISRGVRRRLPEGYDVGTHFAPRYDPWDQRLCIVPNGDLFDAITQGRADVVTDEIARFTSEGVALRSGSALRADVIVTATGLDLLAFGGMRLTVDGEDIDLPSTMAYKSMMLTTVPNFAFAIGYTNASWTLKVDLTSEYVCRLLNHLRANDYRSCVPVRNPSVDDVPFLDFQAGYVVRSLPDFPRQGTRVPWRVTMNYLRDRRTLRHGSVVDDMHFV